MWFHPAGPLLHLRFQRLLAVVFRFRLRSSPRNRASRSLPAIPLFVKKAWERNQYVPPRP